MKPVTIYSKTICPYCTKAKFLFKALGVEYEVVNFDEDPEKREEMFEKYSWRTVPMIFIGDDFIGGYDDLARLRDEGRLEEKLGME